MVRRGVHPCDRRSGTPGVTPATVGSVTCFVDDSEPACALLATISGYEVFVVALALVALAVMVGSALLGVVARFRRGFVDDEPQRPSPSDSDT